MRLKWIGLALAILPVYAQTGNTKKTAVKPVPPGDWPTYTRDLAGTRYSPLTQITTGNVATLTEAWSFRIAPPAPGGGGGGRGAAPPSEGQEAPPADGAAAAAGRGSTPRLTANAEATPIVVNG